MQQLEVFGVFFFFFPPPLCAQLYLKLHPGLSGQFSPRMDIIEILYREDGAYVRHTANAFSLI